MISTEIESGLIHEFAGFFSNGVMNWNLSGFKPMCVLEFLRHDVSMSRARFVSKIIYGLVELFKGLVLLILQTWGILGLLIIIGIIVAIVYVAVIYQGRKKERIPTGPDDPSTA